MKTENCNFGILINIIHKIQPFVILRHFKHDFIIVHCYTNIPVSTDIKKDNIGGMGGGGGGGRGSNLVHNHFVSTTKLNPSSKTAVDQVTEVGSKGQHPRPSPMSGQAFV